MSRLMTLEIFRNLTWLPAAPADFAARCKKVAETEGSIGNTLRELATFALDENQLALAPLTPVRLGLLGNGTLDFIDTALVATAARHGIALEVVRGAYDQFLQDALLPGSEVHQAKPDAVLLALDHRALSLRTVPGDQELATRTIDAAIGMVDAMRTAIRHNSGAA